MLVTLTLPLTAPPELGANDTASGTDCPGVKTVPLIIPLALNPAPVTPTPEIVTLELPAFFTVVVSCLLL